jgi:hypothetical protein
VFQKTILTGKRMADLFAPTGAEAIKTYICTKETAEAVLPNYRTPNKKLRNSMALTAVWVKH